MWVGMSPNEDCETCSVGSPAARKKSYKMYDNVFYNLTQTDRYTRQIDLVKGSDIASIQETILLPLLCLCIYRLLGVANTATICRERIACDRDCAR